MLRGGAAAGAALLSGGLTACSPPRPDPGTVIFRGWAYEPDLVRANLKRLEYPPVDFQPIAGNYHDKMVALFVAKTAMDVCYVRDNDFAEWVEARWLRPIDDLPGARGYREDILEFNWEAMTYKGRQYGMPYYSDFTIWVHNERMLHAAGFETCGATLDEITEQLIKIKEMRFPGVDAPLVLGFLQGPIGFNDWWSLNYGSEIDLFTDDFDPIFPDDEGGRAERILQWIVDGMNKHGIIDRPTSFTTNNVRDLFATGRQAMISMSKYDLQRLNDPRKSNVAGLAKMTPYPSLDPDQSGTLGWTRMYCITSHCQDPELAWQLVQFVGGRDASGEYGTARMFYEARGLGFAFKSLLDDPAIIRATAAWGDIKLIRKQALVAKARENIKTPWFPEFDTFYQAELQEVFLGRRSPRDGLGRIAKECRRLKKRWA